jgi:Zn finger protein HypA/HybF involved in hydrogenase expression
LWGIFGDIIYANLEENLKGTIACDECGKRIKRKSPRMKYCDECWKEIRIQQNRDKSNKYYYKNK